MIRRLVAPITVLAGAYATALMTGYAYGNPALRRHHVESAIILFALLALTAAGVAATVKNPEPTRAAVPQSRLPVLAVLGIGCLVCYRTLWIGLLSDDYVLKEWSTTGQWRGIDSVFLRPIPLAVWRAVFTMGGGAIVLHALNAMLHLGNIVLTASIAKRLGLGRVGWTIAAVVFAAWPTQVEPIAWASAIFDVMMTTFVLAVVRVSLSEAKGHAASRSAAVAVLTMCALLSKETAIALPVLVCVIRLPVWRHTGLNGRDLGMIVAMIACCAAYVVGRFMLDLPLSGAPLDSRYIWKEQASRTVAALAVPFSASSRDVHPYLLPVFGTAALAGVTVIAFARSVAHFRVIALQGLLWSVLAAAPTVGYLLIGPYLEGSRYLYLPIVGWGLFAGACVEFATRRRASAVFGLAVMIFILTAAFVETGRRVSDWTNAARERTVILERAEQTAVRHGCGAVVASLLPPRYKGAQLFNNGFAEAFAQVYMPEASRPSCTLKWTGGSFEVIK